MSWSDGLASDASLPAMLLAAVQALGKLATSTKKPLHKLIRTECDSIARHIIEQHKRNQELMRSGNAASVVVDTDADKYFLVLKLACETGQAKIMCVALDVMQKLVAHGYLHGGSAADPRVYADPNPHRARRQQQQQQQQQQQASLPVDASPESTDAASSPVTRATRSESDSLLMNAPPASAIAAAGSDGKLIAVLIDTLHSCSQYKDASVHLLVLKCVLTCVTSSNVGVHGWSLLQAVSTCYQIYLANPSASNSAADETNRVTARATLTQIVNLVFQRMEHFASQLRQIQTTQQQQASAAAEAQQANQQQQQQQQLKVPPVSVMTPDPSTSPMASPSPDPSVSSVANGDGASPSPSPVNSTAGEGTPPPQGPPQPGRRGFCVWCSKPANHYCLQTKESVCSMECKLANLRARDPDDALTGALKRKVQLQAELCQNDAYYLLRALCKLAIKNMPASASGGLGQDGVPRDAAGLIAVESKVLTLQLLLSILSNAGPTFRTSKHFLATVKGDLVNCLLRNSAASSIETIFALASSLFVALVCHFKPHLHAVLGPVLGSIYLPYIASPNSTFAHKYISLTVLHKLCADPQTLVELFVNYDCDQDSMANIFQMMSNTLEKVCRSRLVSENWLSALEEGRLRLLALEALVDTIKSLLVWTKHAQAHLLAAKSAAGEKTLKEARGEAGYDSDEDQPSARGTPAQHSTRHLSNASSTVSASAMTPSSTAGGAEDKMLQFHSIRAARAKLDTGILKFNMKPKKGLAYLAAHKLVDAESPSSVAEFFLANQSQLDKVTMGEFMGDEAEFNKQVLYAYTERLDFKALAFDAAIRKFLQGFWLPGEAQKIDRMMEKFAEQFHKHNPGVFSSADTAYVLAYSVIMLNVDAHSPMVKARMTREEFFRNTRGIDDGKDVNPAFLSEIYDSIVRNEIKMKDDAGAGGAGAKSGGAGGLLLGSARGDMKRGDRMANFISESEGLVSKVSSYLEAYVKKHEAELKAQEAGAGSYDAAAAAAGGGADGQRRRLSMELEEAKAFYLASEHDVEAVRPMFEILWYPSLATFSVLLEESDAKGEISDASAAAVAGGQGGANSHAAAMHLRTVELCLDGYRHSIRLSSALGLETSRLAFVTSLRKFTLLGSTREMKLKNIEAIKMLLHISHTEGNALKESWIDVLTCISELERLGHVNTGPGGGARGPIADVFQSTPVRPRESDSLNSLHVHKIDASSIDRVFTSSAHLDSEAIVDFVKALRSVSEAELSSPTSARIFSLQKIVEITYYNMSRIRVVWSRIWAVLSAFFCKAGTHPNLHVCMYAIDSLRQLASKFLEKDELASFHFQKHFFRPFELIMMHNPSHAARELIVECMSKMVESRVQNIKSGWRGVFVVIQTGAAQSFQPLVQSSFRLLSTCMDRHFELLTSTTDTMDELVNCLVAFGCNSFTDISLKAIAYMNQCADHLGAQQLARREKLAAKQAAAAAAAAEGSEAQWPSTPARSRGGSTIADAAAGASSSLSVSTSVPSSPVASGAEGASSEELEQLGLLSPSSGSSGNGSGNDMHAELKVWFLALTGLSRMVGDPRLEVRTRALVTLFKILGKHGALFSQSTWRAIFHGVLFPIFDDVRHAGSVVAAQGTGGLGHGAVIHPIGLAAALVPPPQPLRSRTHSRQASGNTSSGEATPGSSADASSSQPPQSHHVGSWANVGSGYMPGPWRNVNNWAWPASGVPKQHHKPQNVAPSAATAPSVLSPAVAVNGIGAATTGAAAAAATAAPSSVVQTPRSIPALPPKPPTMPTSAPRLPSMPPPLPPSTLRGTAPRVHPAPIGSAPAPPDSWLSTTCFSALSTLVELFEHFYASVGFMLGDLLQLIHSCIGQESEDLARIGVKCMVMLLLKCGPKLSVAAWWQALESCAEIVQRSLPVELMSPRLKQMLGLPDDNADPEDVAASASAMASPAPLASAVPSAGGSRSGSRAGSRAGSRRNSGATQGTNGHPAAESTEGNANGEGKTEFGAAPLSVNVTAPLAPAGQPSPAPLHPTPSPLSALVPPSPGATTRQSPSPASSGIIAPPSPSPSSGLPPSAAAAVSALPFNNAAVIVKFKVQLWLLDALFQIVDAFFPTREVEEARAASKANTAGAGVGASTAAPAASDGQELDFLSGGEEQPSKPTSSGHASSSSDEDAPLGVLTCEQLFFALDLLSSSLNFSRAFNSHVLLRRKLYAVGFQTEHTLQGRLPQLFLQEIRATRLYMHLLFRLIREAAPGEDARGTEAMDGNAWIKQQREAQAAAALVSPNGASFADDDLSFGSSAASLGGATPVQASYSAYVRLSEGRLLGITLRFLSDYVSKSVSGQLVSLEFSEELLCSFVENVARVAAASPRRFRNYLSVWFHPLIQLVAFATPPIRAHLALLLQHALPDMLPVTPIVPFPLQRIVAPTILVPQAAATMQHHAAGTMPPPSPHSAVAAQLASQQSD